MKTTPLLSPLKYLGTIHKLRRQERGEGELAKYLYYYISLCSKLAYGGGRGGLKLAKSCLRSLWMVPFGKVSSAFKIGKVLLKNSKVLALNSSLKGN